MVGKPGSISVQMAPFVAILRSDEIGADQQQNHLRRIQVFVDLFRPFRARADFAVVPFADDPLAPQIAQMTGPTDL
jgi:hypothetical protein